VTRLRAVGRSAIVLGGPTYSDGVARTVESTAGAQALPAEAVRADGGVLTGIL